MRLIAVSTLRAFANAHPDAKLALERWIAVVRASEWTSTADVQASFSKAKILNADRVRFEIGGGKFRLIAAFDFRRAIVFVKFIGTHAAYDRIDVLKVLDF